MASIRRITTNTGSTRWVSRWREPGPGGELIGRSQNHDTQKEAKAHADRMHRERELGRVGDANKDTLASYLTRWLAHLEARGDHSPTTLAAYRRHAGCASHHIGHVPLDRLTPLDLDRLYTAALAKGGAPRKDGRPAKPLSRLTVLHLHRVLHCALKQATRWRLIATNPSRDVSPPRVAFAQKRGYTAAEVTAMLQAAGDDPQGYAALALLLTTGLRRSELLGLTLDDIDLGAGTVTVCRTVLEARGIADVIVRETTKTASSRRTLAIPENVVGILREQKARVLEQAIAWGKEYRGGPKFLFPDIGGEPLQPMKLTIKLRQFRRAGIEERPRSRYMASGTRRPPCSLPPEPM